LSGEAENLDTGRTTAGELVALELYIQEVIGSYFGMKGGRNKGSFFVLGLNSPEK
jgi:hypothetical protein